MKNIIWRKVTRIQKEKESTQGENEMNIEKL